MRSHEELYSAWALGDAKAGGELIDQFLGPVERFFANKVGERHQLEDLVAETFELCAHSLGSFRGDSTFRAYLYGIARNVLRGYVRKKGRFLEDPDFSTTAIRDVGPPQSAILHHKDEQRLLLEALRGLPLDLQILLELSYFEGMGRSEIAATLDLPEGTVATRIGRARELLRIQLAALSTSPRLLEATATDVDGWARQLRELLCRGDF